MRDSVSKYPCFLNASCRFSGYFGIAPAILVKIAGVFPTSSFWERLNILSAAGFANTTVRHAGIHKNNSIINTGENPFDQCPFIIGHGFKHLLFPCYIPDNDCYSPCTVIENRWCQTDIENEFLPVYYLPYFGPDVSTKMGFPYPVKEWAGANKRKTDYIRAFSENSSLFNPVNAR